MSHLRPLKYALVFLFVFFLHLSPTVASATPTPPVSCLYALDPTASRAFQIAGAQSIYTACSIMVESTASDAFEMEGSETLYLQNHSQVSVVGGAQINGQIYLRDTISNQQVQPVQTTSPGDPLASIAPPTSGTIVKNSPTYYDQNSKPANNTLSPGVYCGGLTIGNTNGTSFTFSPGVYIMAGGGMLLNSQASVSGTGVTIYNTSSAGWGCSNSYNYTPITISGQVTANLSAPTTGAFNGILFFGNRTGCATPGSCQDQINGGSTAILNGALYFKSDQIVIADSNTSGYTMLVADKIYINGSSAFAETGDPYDGISVSISPSLASLTAGQTQQFTATVTGTNTAVTWTLAGAGSISSTGLYTAPASVAAQQTVTVTATSQADTSKSGSATITLLAAQPPVTVSVNPASATVYSGQTQQLIATVTNSSNTGVTWSIAPAGLGTISAAGLYTAPSGLTSPQTITVTATSQADTTKSATSTLTLSPPVSVSVTPASATLYAGQTQQLTATVANSSNTSVTWSVSGVGTVSASGLYTAPASITTQQTATVKATSVADSTKSASAIVTLNPPVSVAVTPATAQLYAGQTQQFTSAVTNSSNTAVTWSINPSSVGTITSAGLYFAPASIASVQSVTVTATSQFDTTKTASATLTLEPPVAVSVSPTSATLYASQTQQLTASVTNTTNTAVTWTISPSGVGTITSAGLYTAPASIASVQGVTVTATSQADTTQSSSVTLTLEPAVVVSVTPASATLLAGQMQQFTSTVTNSGNAAVTWTISPDGAGTISASGLYTAPSSIGTSQTVTITATSQADASKSATATVTLSPPACTLNSYGFRRALKIDHTQVPNTDQTDFPVLISGTYAYLATVANGGKLQTGSDLIFTSDAAGLMPLDYEIDGYNAVSGAASFWVRIPTLSHTSDTVIYLWYGNAAVTSSQENKAGVWRNNYLSVYHLGDGTQVGLNDSGSAAYTLAGTAGAGPGFIGGGVALTGDPSVYLAAESVATYPSGSSPVTIEAWFQQGAGAYGGEILGYGDNTGDASHIGLEYDSQYLLLEFSSEGIITPFTPDNNWHHYVGVYGGGALDGSTDQIYLDGVSQFNSTTEYVYGGTPAISTAELKIGGMPTVTNCCGVTGSIDEVRVSNGTRSADWVATEYNNVSTPATFYQVLAENAIVNPSTVTLYSGQTEQFTATPAISCPVSEVWSIDPAGTGSIDQTGLYTAPAGIATAQTVTVTATSQTDQTQSTAMILLSPPVALSITPASSSIYSGATQQLTALVTNSANQGVTWSISPVGFGSITAAGLYTSPTTYTSQVVTITATSHADPTQSASATIAVNAPVQVSVAPFESVLFGGQSVQLTASVFNTTNTAVVWSLSSPVGTLSATGLYTAPATITQFQYVIATATSVAQPTVSSYAYIILQAPVTVSLTPVTASLGAGQTQQFQATATDVYGLGVTWSLGTGGAGSVDANGLYTAPAAIATQQTVPVVATSTADPTKSATATVTLQPLTIGVAPTGQTLGGGQTLQYTATVANTNNTSVTWQVSPAGQGSISATGLYSAPALVSSAQAVSVQATSVADPTKSASVILTLLPVAVAVSPLNATLSASQTLQYAAQLANTGNQAVTWSIAPASLGTITAAGLYTAPATVATPQTVTITATSVADPTRSASVALTLSPVQCGSNGYSYSRAIVIDHTQVPNTDQPNFPFLFNTTDPSFATIANGGHVTNASGYDITFTTDANGFNKLDYELEKYDPATGQLTAWVRLPALSHTNDTVIYVFYGNANIAASQLNATSVWDPNYQAVYHLGSVGAARTPDSTAYLNNAPLTAVSSLLGEIAGAGAFDGASSYLQIPSPAFQPYPGYPPSTDYPLTFSTWFRTSTAGVILSQTSADAQPGGAPSGFIPALYVDTSGHLEASFFRFAYGPPQIVTAGVYNDNLWHNAVVTYLNGVETLYVDGQVTGTQQGAQFGYSTAYYYFVGTGDTDGWQATTGGWMYFHGTLDEVELSNTARSSDWVVAQYRNQSVPSSFYTLYPESAEEIIPSSVSLYATQSRQFITAGACNSASVWSLSSGAQGTLSSTGLYTAPDTIETPQTLTVTATTLGASSTQLHATVTLLPPVSIGLLPFSATLTPGQTQQFNATVANASNTTVTWKLSPAGIGSVDATGLYTAPSYIGALQTVVLTATSQYDATQSASAIITLSPTGVSTTPPTGAQCGSNGYTAQRAIVIDHTKVPNSDQINFPFLFNTTDPALATIVNGGQMTNANGYDLYFSTDPNGGTKLDHELELYNPVTGQTIAWVRVPTLSHVSDTVIYVFYGNPNVTASQQNAAGVWDANTQAVYHLANYTASSTTLDSTANNNVATISSVGAAAGVIDGGASFSGGSYIQIPPTDFPNYPTGLYANGGYLSTATTTSFEASVGMWFKTATAGGLLMQVPGQICNGEVFGFCFSTTGTLPGAYDPDGWNSMLEVNTNGVLVAGGIATTTKYTDNQWHFAAVTYATDGTNTLYVDGKSVGTAQAYPQGYSPTYAYFLGTVYTLLGQSGNSDWLYLNGSMDEVTISNSVRSADWIQAEYNNQGSPSTFYSFSPASTTLVTPSPVSLYAYQSQQFVASGICDSSAVWTLSGPGTLSAAGLYTAPGGVTSTQSATVTATSQSGTTLGTSTITLLPAAAPITLTLATPSPYTTGASQSFLATVLSQDGTPVVGASVTFTASGANNNTATGTTDRSGIARFSYAGSLAGTDQLQVTATVNGTPYRTNLVSVTWILPVTTAPTASVTLTPEPSVGLGGLIGAFTDSYGDVIEPVSIGSLATELLVPAGATQLQLGVNDNHYADNGGAGFTVAVNGVPVLVPATAMPWNWTRGALNNNYQYSLNDGTAPIVAATGLYAGQVVTVAYQSGLVSTQSPLKPGLNADGDPTNITGTAIFEGAYYPTVYTAASAYPANQPIPLTAHVVDATGAPVANAAVTLGVAGANRGQYQASTDSTGAAAFLYTGQNTGNDLLQAQVTAGQTPLVSGTSAVAWAAYPNPPPPGTMALSLFAYLNDQQAYTVLVTDTNGAPIQNTSVGFYITGVDTYQVDTTTDTSGHASFEYFHGVAGAFSVVAAESAGRGLVTSNTINGVWTVPTGTSTCSYCNSIQLSISAARAVTLPNTLQLNGTATDNVGITPTYVWTKISGPGTVTFADATQAATTAAFSEAGNYVLQLTATDTGVSASEQLPVAVNPPPTPVIQIQQGFLGSPISGSTLTGIVPITVAAGTTLQSGTLLYYAASDVNLTHAVTLNASVTGGGQIGTFDTTLLANGSYWIQLQAISTTGVSQYSTVLVTVAGNLKPGRVTASVTDLVVPATGIAINIQRQYDSLNAATSSDFGYGWSLGTRVDLAVDPTYNVTFTLGGQRRTFYFQPQYQQLLLNYLAAYTPEPGFNGTLTAEQDETNCPLGYVVADGSLWLCGTGELYSPLSYTYTDPTGTKYHIGADGTLKSVTDIGGNSLTITPAGITSSTGLSVPFVRDASGRITQITDPQGNQYLYTYDATGNLATVTYPGVSQPSSYTYTTGHLYTGGTDFRANPLPTTQYAADGRLQSVTNALGQTTSYAYDLTANTTTTTYPPDAGGNVGTSVTVYDGYGMVLSSTDPLGLTTTNVYDANHKLTSVTDPLGHVNSYTYDANGNRASSTYPATATSHNTTSTATHNQFGATTSVTDELGNTRVMSYDANAWPQTVTDALGPAASFIFNANGTLQAGALGYDLTVNPAAAAQFDYDSNGNKIAQTDALGRTTTYTYDTLGHKLTMTVPSLSPNALQTGNATVHGFTAHAATAFRPMDSSTSTPSAETTTFTYNSLGFLLQTVGPLGRTQSYQYDSNGNQISYTDPLGHVTTYQYDALNRLTITTYPTQPVTTTTLSYDFRGNVIDYVDEAGHDTHRTYDLSGRLLSNTSGYQTASASTTTYTYDAAGHRVTETDALGRMTTYTYDAAGHVTAVSGSNGNFNYTYDDAGNRTAVTDGDSNTTQFQYDSRKRVVKTIYADRSTATYTYDGAGHLAAKTDQNGNTVQYNYDTTGHLSGVVQLSHPNPANNVNLYGYDNDTNLNVMTDENGHSKVGKYDLLSNLSQVTQPDGTQTESATYDLAGNVLSWQHYSGKTTSYTYDAMYRLLTKTPDPSLSEPVVTFTYTATGQPATMTDGSGTTTYTYDSLDRLTVKATPQGTLNYSYDVSGLLVGMTSSNANGVSVTYAYDSQNRLASVVDNRLPAGQNTTVYGYDAASNVVSATYPNGLQSSFTWDSRHRLTNLATPVSSYAYQLDAVGNRTSATEGTGRTLSWNYDGINRLTGETISQDPGGKNGSVTYGLDPVGNRISSTSTLPGVPSSAASYNADDLLSTESYDPNGNTLSSGGRAFTYDSDNRLIAMNGGAVQLQYDGWGNRVAKTVAGVTTRYLVDDLSPTGYSQVVEELVNGSVTRQYTYGFQRINESQTVQGAWTPSFYGYDGMGSVRQLTSLAGTVTDTYSYDAFGNLLEQTGTTPNNFLYRGEEYDANLNLQYLRARYYNTVTGRFLSKDAYAGNIADPKTLHKYLYAGSNPVNWRDPSGLAAEEEVDVTDDEISLNTERAVERTGKTIDCVLDATADALLNVVQSGADAQNLFYFVLDVVDCNAQARGKGHEPKEGEPSTGKPKEEEPPACKASTLEPVEFDPADLHPDTVTPDNPQGIFEYLATGTYPGDRQTLLDLAGMGDPGPQWVNHHIGYDPETNTMRGQLVDREVHKHPHRGGAAEYKKKHGCGYTWP